MNKKYTKRSLALIGTLSLAAAPAMILAGCSDSDGPFEEAGESIDDAADDVGDSLDDAADEVEDAVDG